MFWNPKWDCEMYIRERALVLQIFSRISALRFERDKPGGRVTWEKAVWVTQKRIMVWISEHRNSMQIQGLLKKYTFQELIINWMQRVIKRGYKNQPQVLILSEPLKLMVIPPGKIENSVLLHNVNLDIMGFMIGSNPPPGRRERGPWGNKTGRRIMKQGSVEKWVLFNYLSLFPVSVWLSIFNICFTIFTFVPITIVQHYFKINLTIMWPWILANTMFGPHI